MVNLQNNSYSDNIDEIYKVFNGLLNFMLRKNIELSNDN